MSISKIHRTYALKVGSTVVGHVSNLDYAANLSEQTPPSGVSVDPMTSAIFGCEPIITCTTQDLNAIFNTLAIGVDGKLVSGSPAIEAWQQDADLLDSTPTHRKITSTKAYVVPQSISARQDSYAETSLQIIGIQDGANLPFAFSDGSTLPTVTLGSTYTVGPVFINLGSGETEVVGVQESNVDFGITMYKTRGSGEIYTPMHAIQERKPTITVKVTNANPLADAAMLLGGKATTVRVQFLKKDPAVGNAASGHFQVTCTSARVAVRSVSGGYPSETSSELLITPLADGTNAIMQFAFTA